MPKKMCKNIKLGHQTKFSVKKILIRSETLHSEINTHVNNASAEQYSNLIQTNETKDMAEIAK
jgi:hypothetical protein